jgi:hypothetical protein
MSRSYILECLREGGAQFGGIPTELSSGINNPSVEKLLEDEVFIKSKKSKDPSVVLHNERMDSSQQSKLETGQKEWRDCKITLSAGSMKNLVSALQNNMKLLKDELRDGIEPITKYYNKQIEDLQIPFDRKGTIETPYEFFIRMKNNADDALKRYMVFSETHRNYITKIQKTYNQMKKGVYPISGDKLATDFAEIYEKLGITPDKPILIKQNSIIIQCDLKNVSDANEVNPQSVIQKIDLLNQKITVKYSNKTGKEVYIYPKFSQICISEGIESKTNLTGGSFETIPLFTSENSFSETSNDF